MFERKLKTGPKGPREGSLATAIRRMLIYGHPDEVIVYKLRAQSPHPEKLPALVKWHRWKLRQLQKVVADILR